MLNTYVDFNKCNCNLYDIKQLINIVNMDNVEDTIGYNKKIYLMLCVIIFYLMVFMQKK